MEEININNLILEKRVFIRSEIEKRMKDRGFNSISKFELFIWDLEMFLQLQKKLGDKIILKGGAAVQFYIPIDFQRTSVDIDMICLAKKEEVQKAICEIEIEFAGERDYYKFRYYKPNNPKMQLDLLDTYFVTIPSICNSNELYATRGKQEVKIEFIYYGYTCKIEKNKYPELFALKTEKEFNILAFEDLFADKLTTLGPNTIGISDERADEQFKQIYDVITLFISNIDKVFMNKELIKTNYEKVAKNECRIHGIQYNFIILYKDIKLLIDRIKNIENDKILMQKANDFQALYLRNFVNRDKSQWVIAGYQIDLLIEYLFYNDLRILKFKDIEKLINRLKFKDIKGPKRGQINKKARDILKKNFEMIPGLSMELFRKRIDRIIWELVFFVPFVEIEEVTKGIKIQEDT